MSNDKIITKYELHNLESKKLPFIFHYNIISQNQMSANWHENLEIIYVTKGSGYVICNSAFTEVSEGDVFIINSGMLHRMTKNHSFEYYCLIVDSDFLTTNDIPVDNLRFQPLIRSEAVSTLFRNVVTEFSSEKSYRISGIRAQVLQLMVYLARNHSQTIPSGEKSKSSDEHIKRAIDYIKTNYPSRLTLKSIAEEVNLSKYYFAREFKKATGMTVITYINATRCHYADKMLQSHQYSVNEIASRCGFENNSYFSKTFKNIMGCLPSEVIK